MAINRKKRIQMLPRIFFAVIKTGCRSVVASSAITLVLLLWLTPAVASGLPFEILPIRLNWHSVWLLWVATGWLCAVVQIMWSLATHPMLQEKEGGAKGALHAR